MAFFNSELKKILITTAKWSIIPLLIGLIIASWYFGPASLWPKAKQTFVIKLSDKKDAVIEKLIEQKFIRNKKGLIFALGNKDILPGAYYISPSMDVFNIANRLTRPPGEVWIQIPEGLRREEIGDILAKKLLWDKGQINEFLNVAKEGFLFPSTYLVKSNTKPEEVAKKLQDQFDKETEKLFANEEEKIETIVLASLIQREAFSKNDMPIISEVIKNRLARGMRLQIDASIQYILGTAQTWWPVVTKNQYKINSPMNTYQQKGLPPSPICSPGLDAIKAALLKPQGQTLYYLHDSSKNIRASDTYQEHQLYYDTYIR